MKSLDNKIESINMARRIQDYWHRRGFLKVRVWSEKVMINEATPRENMFYQIRSNLKLTVPQIR